ncbi:hypothetical protein C4K40_3050 [Pseudomonas sp. CMR5c]|nr:hypothetical protein C4K40_3050 [Pseudomonas sp. CMR5c]
MARGVRQHGTCQGGQECAGHCGDSCKFHVPVLQRVHHADEYPGQGRRLFARYRPGWVNPNVQLNLNVKQANDGAAA